MKARFFDFVIRHFESRLGDKTRIELDEMAQYDDLLQLMYSLIFPPLDEEGRNLWALGVPVTPVVFYGTEPFYDMLRDPLSKELKVCMIDQQDRVRSKLNLEAIYSVILEKLYGHAPFSGQSVVRSVENEATGLSGFFRLNFDSRFIETFPNGPLPELDPAFFRPRPQVSELLPWLTEHLPLSGFRFEGISAITVTDVTTEYVTESIKSIILNPDYCNDDSCQDEVERYLKILSGTSAVSIGLLPLLRVNDRPVFSDESWDRSALAKAVEKSGSNLGQTYLEMAEDYFREPGLILHETIPGYQLQEPFYLDPLRRDGIKAFAVMPVFYNSRVIGALEVSSRKRRSSESCPAIQAGGGYSPADPDPAVER